MSDVIRVESDSRNCMLRQRLQTAVLCYVKKQCDISSEDDYPECSASIDTGSYLVPAAGLMNRPTRLLQLSSNGSLEFAKSLPAVYPPYAILSHTWGTDEEELKFADVHDGTGKETSGYTKIVSCGQQAKRDKLDYFWVDTCCIDKASSSELTEAINSMFEWYRGAEKCYVYLADVSLFAASGSHTSESVWHEMFKKSRWHSRGWTLQELLAPASVEFFSRSWSHLGNKDSLCHLLQKATNISALALQGGQLSNFGTEERISWAKRRKTKKPEDKWYSLFGIFGVHLPLIYGEGENAEVRLREEIAKLNKNASQHPQSCLPNGSGKERREALMDRLTFAQIDSRKSTIKRPLEATCQWLLENNDYLAWLDPQYAQQHHGFLWIKGKPGAGKSTIMKFAHTNAEKTRPEDEVLVSFFFNARGDELERSTMGMYRSILLQLLTSAGDLRFVLDELDCPSNHESQGHVWTIEDLQRLISAAITQLGDRPLKCFVDALDESDEEQVREMIWFLEDLGENALQAGRHALFCLASRHYPSIDIRHGRHLILEDESGHSEDLQRYVHRHLRTGRGKMVAEVRAQILEKANGVFMWVVLVVQILNKEFISGRIFAVKERLSRIPPKLSDLFRDMLLRDQANLDELLLCLQWILFAARPLSSEEYYFAMVSGLHETITDWDPEVVTVNDMSQYVLNSSKGLAELSKSSSPRVQFIHESVRDFLIKDGGLRELWPSLGHNVHGLSHDRLKICCQDYRAVDISLIGLQGPRHGPLRSSYDGYEYLPFHAYASGGLLYHANEAAKTVPQHAFLDDLALGPLDCLTDVLELGHRVDYNLLGFDSATQETQAYIKPRLVYMLAEYGYAHLVVAARENGYPIDQHGGRFQLPFFAALANGHAKVVQALLRRDWEPNSREFTIVRERTGQFTNSHGRDTELSLVENDTPLYWALREGEKSIAEAAVDFEDNQLDVKDDAGRNWVSLAAERGYAEVVEMLVVRKFDMLSSDKSGRTPLRYAIEEKHEHVTRVLLQSGADANASGGQYGSVLQVASHQGNESIVRLLLHYGAEVNAQGGPHGNALQTASTAGRASTVRLLLEEGADVNACGGVYGNALQAAAHVGHESTARLLLESGADINAWGGRHGTALLAASAAGHAEVVELLLRSGADATASRGNDSTALYLAAWHSHEEIVQQLIQHGVDVNTQGGFYGNALQAASVRYNEGIIRLLLKHGASLNEPGVLYDSRGRTTYTSAYYRGLQERRAARLPLLRIASEMHSVCSAKSGQLLSSYIQC